MKISKNFALLFFIILVIPFLNAQAENLAPVKQNTCVSLRQECADCTYVKITSLTFPNASMTNINDYMTKTDTSFNYSFCDTSALGDYTYCTLGDVGGVSTVACIGFQVTGNGKADPSGLVIVLFSIAFLIIMGFLVYELILSIGHFASLDLDAVDLAKCLGTYFALFALYELSLFYLGNPDIDSWLLLFIKIGGFTHILVPLVGFIISITVGSLKKKSVDFGTSRLLRRKQIG